jgi:c-di-GMP-binding flagellar brake protein YcgR
MPEETTLEPGFFEKGIVSVTITSVERSLFPFRALSILVQAGMATIQMTSGRPIDLNRNEKICVVFEKENRVYRFLAVVQSIGVRGPLKLVAQPASNLEETHHREHARVACEIAASIAERVEVRGRWGNKTELPAVIESLSVGGLRLRSKQETAQGATFRLRFALPGQTLSIMAYAETIRLDQVKNAEGASEYLVVMKFLSLPEDMQQAIAAYVSEVQQSIR